MSTSPTTMRCTKEQPRGLGLHLIAFASVALASLAQGFTVRDLGHLSEATSMTSPSSDGACVDKPDGYHTDATCVHYWLCRAGKTSLRRACAEGTLFNGLMCVPSALVSNCRLPLQQSHPNPSIECIGLKNGLHRNYLSRDCVSYVVCENGAAILKGKCKNNLVFDGNICVEASRARSSTDVLCHSDNINHTEDDMECLRHKTSGVFVSSNCQDYYYCNSMLGIKSRVYECPRGFTFSTDTQKCVPGHDCSVTSLPPGHPDQDAIEIDFCHDKSDGYYQDPLASGCKSYAFCNKGKKIIYLCPEGYAFDGTKCQVERSFSCPYWSSDCQGKPNGYHADVSTGCRQYFYCLNENKVMTLTCGKSRLFDGTKCAPRMPNVCSTSSPSFIEHRNLCDGKMNGKHVVPESGCRNFVTCFSERQQARGSCAQGFVFVNDDCVEEGDATRCD